VSGQHLSVAIAISILCIHGRFSQMQLHNYNETTIGIQQRITVLYYDTTNKSGGGKTGTHMYKGDKHQHDSKYKSEHIIN